VFAYFFFSAALRAAHPRTPPPLDLSPHHPSIPPFLSLPPPTQLLGLLWLVVEDHDNLFVMAEAVHFAGIAVLAYKLVRKRNSGGEFVSFFFSLFQGKKPPRRSFFSLSFFPLTAHNTHSTPHRHKTRRSLPPVPVPDRRFLGHPPGLLLHDGVRHPHGPGLWHAGRDGLGHLAADGPVRGHVPGGTGLAGLVLGGEFGCVER
jgi:hypothetical protein